MLRTDDLERYQAPAPSRRVAKILVDEQLLGCRNLALGAATYPSGERAEFHVHNGEEIILVLGGRGVVYGEGEQFPIEKGSLVYVPAGEKHAMENTGDTAMEFLFVFCPPGTERTIRQTWKLLRPYE